MQSLSHDSLQASMCLNRRLEYAAYNRLKLVIGLVERPSPAIGCPTSTWSPVTPDSWGIVEMTPRVHIVGQDIPCSTSWNTCSMISKKAPGKGSEIRLLLTSAILALICAPLIWLEVPHKDWWEASVWPWGETHQQKLGHAAVSGPVDSMQFFKCIFFILWTLTVLCWFCHFGTHQNSVYFPILLLKNFQFPLCFQIPGYQAPAASGFFKVAFNVLISLAVVSFAQLF